MHSTKLKRGFRIFILLALAIASLQAARAQGGDRSPDLPLPLCESIQVPEGNKLSYHVYARGVQIYKWNGGTWDFVAPVATLYAEENFFGEVGTHYVGPKWESKSGSKVEARRVAGTGCTPDPTAIAWLLLKKYEATGPGIFSRVTYIQRVNTTGGLAPATPGVILGEVKEVPYTAEYFFYRAH